MSEANNNSDITRVPINIQSFITQVYAECMDNKGTLAAKVYQLEDDDGIVHKLQVSKDLDHFEVVQNARFFYRRKESAYKWIR
ncbi:uncharacterized protein IL334_004779 [Kwoniella shivajii]|uniref:Uncharacterized protein n=1 Tax=Kwoniella shivajii TaxID=564305 RepID=A0ABZ1D311_9TREE|nr:hypothetical protein IL334_004779 [Kwoniella shivajii]